MKAGAFERDIRQGLHKYSKWELQPKEEYGDRFYPKQSTSKVNIDKFWNDNNYVD